MARSRRARIVVIFVLLSAVTVGMFLAQKTEYNLVALQLNNNQQLKVELADDPQERYKGLSDRRALDNSDGMLFVFPEPSTTNCFVMRDTLINLDMLFLDNNKKIVTMHQQVTPNTFPQQFCPSDEPAKYGIELQAGTAQKQDVMVGQTIHFVL